MASYNIRYIKMHHFYIDIPSRNIMLKVIASFTTIFKKTSP